MKNIKEYNQKLLWRYATKKFAADKKIPEDQIKELLESLRLAPSSYGLQHWKFIVVKDQTVKDELRKASWDQSQISDCSHLVVLCIPDVLDESSVQAYIDNIVQIRGVERSTLEEFKKVVLGSITSKSQDDLKVWARKQIYIALGFLLSSCAQHGIDSCPMEGFDSKKYDEILQLKSKGLESVVLCPLGYRHPEDNYAQAPKVRYPLEDLIEFV